MADSPTQLLSVPGVREGYLVFTACPSTATCLCAGCSFFFLGYLYGFLFDVISMPAL